MRRRLFATFALVVIISHGCSPSVSKPTNAPPLSQAKAATPSATAISTLPPDVESRFEQTDILCSTTSEKARQLYNDAVTLQEQGKLDKAEQSYLEAIELDSNYCDAMDNLGQMLRSQGDVTQAIYWYKRSIEVLPNNVVAHQNLAVAYRIQGDIDKTVAEYQWLVQNDPKNPEGYYGLGKTYLELGRTQQSIAQLEKAETLYIENSSPLITDARYLLGVSYFMQEEYEKAKDYFELIYSEMETEPNINYWLGLCYLCLLYTSPSPRNGLLSRMPSSA